MSHQPLLSEVIGLNEKDKITIIRMGGGLPVTIATQYIVKDTKLAQPEGRVVTAVAEPRKRKWLNMDAMVKSKPGVIVLKGHGTTLTSQGELDREPGSHVRTFMIDGQIRLGWSKGPVSEDMLPEIAAWARDNVLFSNLTRDFTSRIRVHGKYNKTEVLLPRNWWASNVPKHIDGNMIENVITLCRNPISDELMDKLVEAGRNASGKTVDSKPICKLFRGAATWLVYSCDEDRDTLWVVADLGMNCVEAGTLSLTEARQRIPGSMVGDLELDKFFDPDKMAWRMSELLAMQSLPTNLNALG